MEYERVHAAALITEKRAKNFDKVLGEWLSKANDVQAEVAASQDEGRNYSSELFRLKPAQDEAVEQLDIVKRAFPNWWLWRRSRTHGAGSARATETGPR